MANKLNMAIAKTHQVSTRLVGMQLTSGNFVAIGLSATQMVAGFIFLVQPLAVHAPIMYGIIAVIGLALAILIERLSLGGLIAVRVSNERIEGLEEEHYQTLQRLRTDRPNMDDKQLAELSRLEGELQEALDRRKTKLESNKKASKPVAAVGMILSAVIGDIFWHKLFEPLGAWYIVYPMSLACAAVIGLTFVYSELYKTIMDSTLGEIIADTYLMKTAVMNEQQNIQIDMVVDGYDHLRKDKTKKEPAQERVEDVLVGQLEAFADRIEDAGQLSLDAPTSKAHIEGNQQRQIEIKPQIVDADEKLLPERSESRSNSRTLFEQHKVAFAKKRADNPGISTQDLADHFGIAKSTAHGWIKKLDLA